MTGAIRIGCDATWASIPLGDDPGAQLVASLPPRPWTVPLTPRACLWVTDRHDPSTGANALASALLGFLHLPIQHLIGTVVLTGWQHNHLAPLTPTQHQAFATTLQTLIAMPDYLALHAQAGRIAAAWSCPTTERFQP